MDDMTCDEVRESAAEFALGVLPTDERAAVRAHMIRCPACRAEIDDMRAISDQLLDIVPGTEPPLGFDRRVLTRVGVAFPKARRRFRTITVLAAAAMLAIVTTVGAWPASGHHHGRITNVEAVFYEGARPVGEVYAYPGANPPWIQMDVAQAQVDGQVTCEIVERDGKQTVVGTFDLAHGSGSWGVQVPAGMSGMARVQLVDSAHRVVATASFD